MTDSKCLNGIPAIAATLLLCSFPLDGAKCQTSSQVEAWPAGSVPTSVIAIPKNSDYYRPYVFVVDKSARSLEIWKFDDSTEGRRKLVKSDSHPADLGKNLGPKVAEGDHKTPEGIYFFLDRLDGSAIDFKQYGSRAYTTNYPNYFDALDGKTGSGIWLHAVPDDVPLTRGSRGCVVVRNGVIGTLNPYIQLGKTPIVISDKIEPRSAEEMEAEQAKLTTWLNLWTTAWAGKSIDQYMAFYDQDFKSLGLNKPGWRQYKERLNKQYRKISVQISQPLAIEHRGRAIVRFVQNYTSDQLSDLGEKTLHLIKRGDEWRIINEEWREDSSAAARAAVGASVFATSENKAEI
ncbi:MAG: L,D-transpeptidase family protein [Deltaproteobacteria bacterium]|nr:L,D-transpeptidase family protein [Deltaproteobacteria bacterium]